MKFDVKKFNEIDRKTLHNIFLLRSEVFIVEQECAYQDIDGKDLKSIHIIGKKKEDGTEIKNDIDLSDYLLDEGVAVVPGEAFGCSNFFRISFATSNENIIEGCDKIVSACKKLK